MPKITFGSGFLQNSEMLQLVGKNPDNMQEVYDEIIAEKFEMEKKLIIQELRKHGIYSIYTLPENLNIEVINKYLEIKVREEFCKPLASF